MFTVRLPAQISNKMEKMTEHRPFTCSYHQQGGEYDFPVQIINKDEEKMTEHSPFTCSDHHVNIAEKMIEHSSFTCSDH